MGRPAECPAEWRACAEERGPRGGVPRREADVEVDKRQLELMPVGAPPSLPLVRTGGGIRQAEPLIVLLLVVLQESGSGVLLVTAGSRLPK